MSTSELAQRIPAQVPQHQPLGKVSHAQSLKTQVLSTSSVVSRQGDSTLEALKKQKLGCLLRHKHGLYRV